MRVRYASARWSSGVAVRGRGRRPRSRAHIRRLPKGVRGRSSRAGYADARAGVRAAPSDEGRRPGTARRAACRPRAAAAMTQTRWTARSERTSGVEGKSGSLRLESGWRRLITKKKNKQITNEKKK